MTVTYILDGTRITSLETFWSQIGEAVNGPGGYFGGNLDALNDCLRGGFGTPEDDDFVIEWRSHAMSRVHLSYPETVRQLEIRLLRCHSNHRESVAADLAAAKLGRGPTVFDWLVEIIGTDHHRLALT